MPRRIFLILPVLILVAAAAEAAEIKGTVVSAAQDPIAGAIVLLRASGARAETDSAGAFSLQVPDGERITLQVIHPDYYEREFVLGPKGLDRPVVLVLTALIKQSQEVIVTALRYPELSIKVPAASAIVSSEALTEKMAPNINDALQEISGVAAIGTGAFSLVPTIRGLARRRVLFLIDGARLESDRRTGPNASFLSPDDIERIEVLRSPSSVFYGSDAIGGVIHVMTKSPSFDGAFHGRLLSSYATVNGEKGAGLQAEGSSRTWGYIFSLNYEDAGLYRIPGGAEVLQSQYTQGSLRAKIAHKTDKREIDLSFLGARGTDIGKPNSTASTKPTWYPRENQNLVQLHWKEKGVGRDGEILFHAFVNPNFLETLTDTYDGYLTKESFARTESTEFGSQLSYAKRLSESFRLEGGLDYFGRAGADAFNRYTSFDASGAVTEVVNESPHLDGSRGDLGFFVSADYAGFARLDLLGGVRYDLLRMQALPLGAAQPVVTTDNQPTGFAGVSYKLTGNLTAFANLSRAYRVASINEKYYTGISGRGFIIGNPDLRPERSLNFDAGLRVLGRRHFFGLYAFSYQINDMIERYRPDPTTYTYGNIEKGRLRGIELEAEAFLRPGWKVFGNVAAIRGRSLANDVPLNDVPPVRFYAGTRYWKGRFSAEANATFCLAKDNPGPAEIAVASSEVVNLRAGYLWRGLNFQAVLSNVFNATFISRADPEAMIEPRRNLRIGIAYAF